MRTGVFIDTQLWVYSKKKPIKERYENGERFEKALETHNESYSFLKQLKGQNLRIYLTTHQVAELYHSLSFRGYRVDLKETLQFIDSLYQNNRFEVVVVDNSHLTEALRLSKKSLVNVWDYLCVLPLKGAISVAYTNDKHFQHPTFQNLGFEIKNPLSNWEVL